jgi:phosphatidylglycerophosphate synthase
MVLYCYSCLSDFLDGYLARKWKVGSENGQVVDLLGDKYLTIISVMYAISYGIPLFPGALIIMKEVVLLSLRGLSSKNQKIVAPNRIIGSLYTIPIWVVTGLLLASDFLIIPSLIFFYFYWIWGILGFLNLTVRIYLDRYKLINLFKED